MIRVDQTLCTGCGSCVEACPTEAITLSEGIALVDAALCDGCAECVEVCPTQALVWVPGPMLEATAEPSSLAVVQPAAKVVHINAKKPTLWQRVGLGGRAVVPVVGAALSWAGRELVPRLAPLALDALEGALDRRLSRRTNDAEAPSDSRTARLGRGRKRRHRRQRGGTEGQSGSKQNG